MCLLSPLGVSLTTPLNCLSLSPTNGRVPQRERHAWGSCQKRVLQLGLGVFVTEAERQRCTARERIRLRGVRIPFQWTGSALFASSLSPVPAADRVNQLLSCSDMKKRDVFSPSQTPRTETLNFTNGADVPRLSHYSSGGILNTPSPAFVELIIIYSAGFLRLSSAPCFSSSPVVTC